MPGQGAVVGSLLGISVTASDAEREGPRPAGGEAITPAPLLAFPSVPTYEYRCPEGHVFELFQRFADPPATECQTCGASPVTKVLYPVAVHFKGSGFYSTDYGRGGRKKEPGKDGDSSSADKPKTETKTEGKKEEPKAKAAEA